MTGPGQPRTFGHPINARTLTGVCQAVRIFSSYYFHVFVSIGTLESDLLSLSTPSGTNWTLFYYDQSTWTLPPNVRLNYSQMMYILHLVFKQKF